MGNKTTSKSGKATKLLEIRRTVIQWLSSGSFFALVVLASFIFVLHYVYDLYRHGFRHPWQFDYTSLGLSFSLLLVFLLGQTLVWKMIVAKLGYQISGKTAFQIMSLANLGAYVPGRIWQVTGLFYLASRENIPKSISGTSLVLSNTLTLSSGALIFLASLALGRNRTTPEVIAWLCVIIAVSLLLSYPKIIQWALNLVLKRLGKTPVHFQFEWRDVLMFLLIYSGTWLLYGMSLVLLLKVRVNISLEMVPGIVGANAASYVLGYIAFIVPAGLGVREVTLSGLLAQCIPLQTTVAVSIFFRFWSVAAQALYAVVALFIRRAEHRSACCEAGEYQNDFSSSYPEMLDPESRRKRAGIIASVMKDFSKKDLGDLTCLEVGCSGAIISAELAKLLGKVVGFDLDEQAVAFARGANDNLSVFVADAMRFPFPDRSFDVVCCNHIYEHVPDSRTLMEEIWRVLKDDGFCYFAAGNRFVLVEGHYHLPLLSWFPKGIADLYLRLTGRGQSYYERLLSLWGLRRLVRDFNVTDYTITVIKNPAKFQATYRIANDSVVTKIPSLMLRLASVFLPMYIWILTKKLESVQKSSG